MFGAPLWMESFIDVCFLKSEITLRYFRNALGVNVQMWKSHEETVEKWSTFMVMKKIHVYIEITLCLFNIAMENHHAINR